MQTILLDYIYQDTLYIHKKTHDKIKIIQEVENIISEIYLLLYHNIIYSKYSIQSMLQLIFTKIQRSFHYYVELLNRSILKYKNKDKLNMEKIIYNIYELFLFYFLLLPKIKNEIYAQSIQLYCHFLRFAFLSTNSQFYQNQLIKIINK